MKKIITLSALVAFTFTSFAQRSIDWSLDEILEPTELISDATTGTRLPIAFSCKNNGTDTITVGDTILYNAILIDLATNSVMIQAPQNAVNGAAYIQLSTKMVVPGDTIRVGRSDLNINSYVTESRDIRVGGSCTVIHRGGSDEITDDSTANNTDFNDIVWYNPQGWGVGIDDVVYNNNISVYPNPSSTIVNVKLLLTNNSSVTVELVDLDGKVVLSNSSVSTFNNVYSMNTENVSNGVYIVKVTNGNQVHTSKLSIVH